MRPEDYFDERRNAKRISVQTSQRHMGEASFPRAKTTQLGRCPVGDDDSRQQISCCLSRDFANAGATPLNMSYRRSRYILLG